MKGDYCATEIANPRPAGGRRPEGPICPCRPTCPTGRRSTSSPRSPISGYKYLEDEPVRLRGQLVVHPGGTGHLPFPLAAAARDASAVAEPGLSTPRIWSPGSRPRSSSPSRPTTSIWSSAAPEPQVSVNGRHEDGQRLGHPPPLHPRPGSRISGNPRLSLRRPAVQAYDFTFGESGPPTCCQATASDLLASRAGEGEGDRRSGLGRRPGVDVGDVAATTTPWRLA